MLSLNALLVSDEQAGGEAGGGGGAAAQERSTKTPDLPWHRDHRVKGEGSSPLSTLESSNTHTDART